MRSQRQGFLYAVDPQTAQVDCRMYSSLLPRMLGIADRNVGFKRFKEGLAPATNVGFPPFSSVLLRLWA